MGDTRITARIVPITNAPIAEKKVSLMVIQNAPKIAYLSKMSSTTPLSAG